MYRIRWPMRVVLVGLALCTLTLQYLHSEYQASRPSKSQRSVSKIQSVLYQAHLASEAEISHGRWVPRNPLFTSLAEYQANNTNPHGSVWDYCRPNSPVNGKAFLSDEEKLEAGQQRLVDMVNWIWKPDFGKIKEWDAEDFVVRLLKSPGGLIVIGDSISGQHAHSITNLLDSADIPRHNRLPHLPLYSHKNVHQQTLRLDHPSTARLLERAGVPESRLERPILTLLEEHMLIGESDIREITELLGAREDYVWVHDYQRVEGWEDFVKNAAAPRVGEHDSVHEDTVIMINAGAHWSRHELAMLPHRATYAYEQATVNEAYEQMVRRVIERLSPIPQLSIYYRSISPGHPVCYSHPVPYANISEARLRERHIPERLTKQLQEVDGAIDFSDRYRWDWDLFEPHNNIWRKLISQMSKRNQNLNHGARWFYLDMWEVDLQRPDAHSEPEKGIDCLHWCMPSVLDQWTFHLYHHLYLETNFRKSTQLHSNRHHISEPLMELAT